MGLFCCLNRKNLDSPYIGVSELKEDIDVESQNDLTLVESFDEETSELEFVPGEVIVKFKEDSPPIDVMVSEKGFVKTGIRSFDMLNEQYRVTTMKKVFDVVEYFFMLSLNIHLSIFVLGIGSFLSIIIGIISFIPFGIGTGNLTSYEIYKKAGVDKTKALSLSILLLIGQLVTLVAGIVAFLYLSIKNKKNE